MKKWRYWRQIVSSMILLSFAAGYFERSFFVSAFYSSLLFIGFSTMPILLRLSGKRPVLGRFVLREMGFSFSFCSLVMFFQILTHWFLPAWVSNLVAVFLQCLYLMISTIYISYYLLDGDLLSTESFIAVYQTNGREARTFFKDSFSYTKGLAVCVVVGSLPFILFFINNAFNVKIIVGSKDLIFVSVLLLFSFINTKSTFKVSYFYTIIKESMDYLKKLKECRSNKSKINFTAILQQTTKDEERTFVLVIGESQRRDHLGVYGYGRETTPWLSAMNSEGNLLLFENAYSCHVMTALVLTKSLTESSQYNDKKFEDSLSIIDVAKKAGFKTYFMSNQEKHSVFGAPCTLISEAADIAFWANGDNKAINAYDEELLPEFAKFKDEPGNKLFILHLKGSHFEYQDRYPKNFRAFDRQRDSCNEGAKRPEKVCWYDNSILYTDYILSEIYRIATQAYNADGIVYFSDHGEAVERDKKHLPGMFGFDMARIPLCMYFSEDYRERNPELTKILNKRQDAYFTNDMIYDTLLGIMNIKTERYLARQDLSSPEYGFEKKDLLTMDGTVRLEEEETKRC